MSWPDSPSARQPPILHEVAAERSIVYTREDKARMLGLPGVLEIPFPLYTSLGNANTTTRYLILRDYESQLEEYIRNEAN